MYSLVNVKNLICSNIIYENNIQSMWFFIVLIFLSHFYVSKNIECGRHELLKNYKSHTLKLLFNSFFLLVLCPPAFNFKALFTFYKFSFVVVVVEIFLLNVVTRMQFHKRKLIFMIIIAIKNFAHIFNEFSCTHCRIFFTFKMTIFCNVLSCFTVLFCFK